MGCSSSNAKGSVPSKAVAPESGLNHSVGLNGSQRGNAKADHHELFSIFPLNPGKITNDYNFSCELGKGAFGSVCRCTHLITGQERAIKVITKEDLAKNKAQTKLYLNEIEIMKSMIHPNVVSIYEYFQDDQYVYIVMELIEGVELLDKVREARRLSEKETCVIMEQLVNTIHYMHSQFVVHRDIKPENILVERNRIKLIDFGGARRFSQDSAMHLLSGTSYYIPPEMLEGTYDERCDIWSLGVIMFVMLTGEELFPGKTDEAIFQKILTGKIKYDHPALVILSEHGQDLLQKLLVRNYKQRVHVTDIVDHPWFEAVRRVDKRPVDARILENLRSFEVESPLQKAIYYYLINNVVSKAERDNLIVAFEQLDTGHDGVLSKEEINEGYKLVGIGMTNKDLQRIIDEVGGVGAEKINYMEFLGAAIDRVSLLTEARIHQCFTEFDHDKSGRLTIKNFRTMLGSKVELSDDEWYDMIKVYDLNSDGVIEYQEFQEILVRLTSRRESE